MVRKWMRPLVLALVPVAAPLSPLGAAPDGGMAETAVQPQGGACNQVAALGALLAAIAAWFVACAPNLCPTPTEPAELAPSRTEGPSAFLGSHLEYGRNRDVLWSRLAGVEQPPQTSSFVAALSEVPRDAFGRTCPGIPHSALGIPERQAGRVDYPIVNRVLQASREILRTELDSARARLNSDKLTSERRPPAEFQDLAPAASNLELSTSRAITAMYQAAHGALDSKEPIRTWEQVLELDRALRQVFDHFQAVSHEVYVNRIGLRISEIELDVVRNRLAGMEWKSLCRSEEDTRRMAALEVAQQVHEADIAAAHSRQDRMVKVMTDVRAALGALQRALTGRDSHTLVEPELPGRTAPTRFPDEETRDP